MKYSIVIKDSEESLKIKNQLIEHFGLSFYDEKNPDVCFAIGGDGTYLSAVHQYIDSLDHITFVNIKTGTLGFYSNMDSMDLNKIDTILQNEKEYVYNDLLEFQINEGETIHAVNEIALYGIPEALKTEIYVDNNLLESFTGTGLVVSTPSGSTGLNKSLSGAIIDEKLKTLQLTEIAGINNKKFKSIGNSVILDSSRIIRIELKDEVQDVVVSYDNNIIHCNELKTLKIKYSSLKVKNLKYIKKDFFERVQKSFL